MKLWIWQKIFLLSVFLAMLFLSYEEGIAGGHCQETLTSMRMKYTKLLSLEKRNLLMMEKSSDDIHVRVRVQSNLVVIKLKKEELKLEKKRLVATGCMKRR